MYKHLIGRLQVPQFLCFLLSSASIMTLLDSLLACPSDPQAAARLMAARGRYHGFAATNAFFRSFSGFLSTGTRTGTQVPNPVGTGTRVPSVIPQSLFAGLDDSQEQAVGLDGVFHPKLQFEGPTEEYDAEHAFTVADAIYHDYLAIFDPTQQGDATLTSQDKYARIRERGISKLLVCATFVRADGSTAEPPVLMVVAAPTLAATDLLGSQWTDGTTVPGAPDDDDLWDPMVASLYQNPRDALLPRIGERTPGHYTESAVVCFSVNGLLVRSVVAKPVREPEETDADTGHYTNFASAALRVTSDDFVMDELPAASAASAPCVLLPLSLPLPRGCPLPPGIIGTADMGPEAFGLLLGEIGGDKMRDALDSQLVTEWVAAVSRQPALFTTQWLYCREHPLLFGPGASFRPEFNSNIEFALYRMGWRIHRDAIEAARGNKLKWFGRYLDIAEEGTTKFRGRDDFKIHSGAGGEMVYLVQPSAPQMAAAVRHFLVTV